MFTIFFLPVTAVEHTVIHLYIHPHMYTPDIELFHSESRLQVARYRKSETPALFFM